MSSGERRYAGLCYEQAVRRYSDTVTKVCVMRLQSMADAEDCYQNTFIKLYYKSPDFTDEEHLKAWLIRVAIRECVSYIRKNRRIIPFDTPVERDAVLFDEDAADLSWALMKTPPKYREALYLYYVERYKVREVADILGKSENTVKTLLKRGRELLRAAYGGDDA